MPNVTIGGLTAKPTDPVPSDEMEIQETGAGGSYKLTLKDLIYDLDVEDHTEADTPVTVADTDCTIKKFFTNAGATATVEYDLPSAVKGLVVGFMVLENQQLTVDAAAGDFIYLGTSVSSSGGTCHANGKGEMLILRCVDGNDWIGMETGTWTLT